MPTLSIDAIQQRITQKDSELRTLRREFEACQNRLQTLSKRKQELRDQLGRIESEIAAVTTGMSRPFAGSPKHAVKKPTSKPAPPTFADLIVEILQDADLALTVQQITEEVRKRRFPTKSKALHKLVGKNAYAMATKGILHRTKDQPAAFKVPGAKAKTAAVVAAKPASRMSGESQPTLKQLLVQFLQKSAKPMTGGELAAAALKAGYRTTSKRLVDGVWSTLGDMKNVENIKGQGYRLKRSK